MIKKIVTSLLIIVLTKAVFAASSSSSTPSYSWQTANSNISMHFFNQLDAYSMQSNYLSNIDFVDLRRSQLGLDGTLYNNIIFSAWYSLTQNTWRKLFLGYRFDNIAKARIGQFYFPGGFSNNMQKQNLNMPELAAPVQAFSPMYVRGIDLGVHYNKVGMNLAAFGPSFGSGYAVSRPYSFLGRFYFSPVHQPQQAFHVGLDVWRVQKPTQMVTIHANPEVYFNSWSKALALIQTNMLNNVNYTQTTDLELAGVYKQLSAMSEYLVTQVNRDNPQQNPNQYYDGYYANLGYFLTGESQRYRFNRGAFGGITPIKHSYGAWQLVSQFSSLDLNSHANIMHRNGGRQNTWSYGVNYFPNKILKFSLNYIDASATGVNIQPYPRQARTFLLRAQVYI